MVKGSAKKSDAGSPPFLRIYFYLSLFVLALLFSEVVEASTPFFFEGARPAGMGGAFVAMADDENAIFYNPAGLAWVNRTTVSSAISVREYSWASVYPLYRERAGSMSNRMFSILSTLGRFGFAYGIRQKGDRFDSIPLTGLDSSGRVIQVGEMFWQDFEQVFCIAYGTAILPNFSVGLTVKYLQSYGDVWRWTKPAVLQGLNVDVGFMHKVNEYFTLGTVFRNIIANDLQYSIETDYSIYSARKLPLHESVGLAIKISERITLAADFDDPFEKEAYLTGQGSLETYKILREYGLGVEYNLGNNWVIRIGARQTRQPSNIKAASIIYPERVSYDLSISYRGPNLRANFAIEKDNRNQDMEKGGLIQVINPTDRYIISCTWWI